MPWKETCAVSERHHLVKLVREGISVSEASRALGISRKTAYKWLGRHDRWGVEGLSDRSRARHRQEHETPPSVRRLVVALRHRRACKGRLSCQNAHRGWTDESDPVSVTGPPARFPIFLPTTPITLSSSRRSERPSVSGAGWPFRRCPARYPEPPPQRRERRTPATTPHAGLLAHVTRQRKGPPRLRGGP